MRTKAKFWLAAGSWALWFFLAMLGLLGNWDTIVGSLPESWSALLIGSMPTGTRWALLALAALAGVAVRLFIENQRLMAGEDPVVLAEVKGTGGFYWRVLPRPYSIPDDPAEPERGYAETCMLTLMNRSGTRHAAVVPFIEVMQPNGPAKLVEARWSNAGGRPGSYLHECLAPGQVSNPTPFVYMKSMPDLDLLRQSRLVLRDMYRVGEHYVLVEPGRQTEI